LLKGLKESKSRTIFDFSVLRWVCLVLLLVTELVWLSLRVDFHPLSGNESWWGGTLSHSNIFASIGLASLAAGLVVGWARGIGKFREGLKFRDISLKTWLLILAQLTAFAIFSWLSIIVTSSQFSALWIFAWAGAGFGTAIFWLLAAMPPRAWFRLSRQGWLIALVALVIGTAAWVLGFLADMTWEPLLRPTFWFVQWLLRALAQEVVSRPADFVLGTKQFSIEIYPPCSGYQGMGLIVVFVGAYLWLFRRRLRFPQAFFLLPFGVLIIWLVNTLRIASLILFGTYGSAEIALGGFHSQTGWLGFILVALGLITASQRIPFFVVTQHNSKVKIEDDAKPKVETRVKDEIEENKPKAEKKAKVIKPTTAYLGPLMVLLAVTMITSVF